MKRVLFLVLVILVLLSCVGVFFPLDFLIALTIGWGFYLYRVVPQIHVNWIGVATAFLCLVGFVVGLHLFLNWQAQEWRQKAELRDDTHGADLVQSVWPVWPVRRTAIVVTAVLLMFTTGMAAAGVAHQLGWLLSSREPFLDGQGGANHAVRRIQSANNLKQLGLAHNAILARDGRFVSGCTVDPDGEPLHSWMTFLLPYLEEQALFDRIDLKRPWNEPVNEAVFKSRVNTFLHPHFSEA